MTPFDVIQDRRRGPALETIPTASNPQDAAYLIRVASTQHKSLTGFEFSSTAEEIARACSVPGVQSMQICLQTDGGKVVPAIAFIYRIVTAEDLDNEKLCEQLVLNRDLIKETGVGDFLYLWKIGVDRNIVRESNTSFTLQAVEHLEKEYELPIVGKVAVSNTTTINTFTKRAGFKQFGGVCDVREEFGTWQCKWFFKEPEVSCPKNQVVEGLFPDPEWVKLTGLPVDKPITIFGRESDFQRFKQTPEYQFLKEKGHHIILHQPNGSVKSSVREVVRVPGMRHENQHFDISASRALYEEIWGAVIRRSSERRPEYGKLGEERDPLVGPHDALIILLPKEVRDAKQCTDDAWLNGAQSRIAALSYEDNAALCFAGRNPEVNMGIQIEECLGLKLYGLIRQTFNYLQEFTGQTRFTIGALDTEVPVPPPPRYE